MKRLKLGVFGGTFNPIHLGHLMIAEEAYQSFQLEKVLFIPSYMTPNKDVPGATAAQRLEMVRLATEDNPHFVVSDMEIRRGGNSYTLDTLQLLKIPMATSTIFILYPVQMPFRIFLTGMSLRLF